MENMSKEEFMRQSEAAIRRMREINSRAEVKSTPHKMPPTPAFVQTNVKSNKSTVQEEKQTTTNNEYSRIKMQQQNSPIKLPFLEIFKGDSDMPIILGLLLLLMSENCDKRLLFALLYILM